MVISMKNDWKRIFAFGEGISRVGVGSRVRPTAQPGAVMRLGDIP